MAIFQGIVLLVFGTGLLLVDYRSLSTGWLPCRPNGFRGRLEFKRLERPFAYWLMFGAYGAGGIWLLALGASILTGRVAPLPLS